MHDRRGPATKRPAPVPSLREERLPRRRCDPSDTWDDEWALIKPLLPTPACETKAGGRPETDPRREIVDAIRYVVGTGCKWRALPMDVPPWRTCYGFMARWAACGVVGQIRDQLRKRIRRGMGRAPGAVATVIDSQSIKAADTVGKDSRGYDAGKNINGRTRHLVVDTKGLPLFVLVTPADMTDRNAAQGSPLPASADAPRNHHRLGRLRLCRSARDLGKDLPGPGDQDRQPPEGRLRVRRSVPALGRRTLTRLDHARPPPRARLRTAHPALGIAHHLGRDHHHD